MPNQRRSGQTFVGFQSDDDFVKMLDSARGRNSRSLFIREAVAEKLRTLGQVVSEDLVYAPDRAARIADEAAPAAAEPAPVPKPVTYRVPRKKRASSKGTRGSVRDRHTE